MPKLNEIQDPVIVSIIAVADRETAETLKKHFGDKPMIMGEISLLGPDDIDLSNIEDYEGFRGAFNATIVAGDPGVDEADGDEHMESVFIEEMEDEDA